MKKILHFKEEITQKTIDTWVTESKHLSKNLRRINNVKDFLQVRRNYLEWIEEFEHFVYKRLMRKQNEDSYLRKVFWEYYIFVSGGIDLFNVFTEKNAYFFGERYDVPEYDRNSIENYPPEAQELLYLDWEKTRDSVYQKHARLRKEAMEALQSYFSRVNKDNKLLDLYKSLPDKVAGVNIKWTYSEEEDFEEIKRRIQLTKIVIERAVGLLSKFNLNYLLKGLTIEVETVLHFSYGGKWEQGKNLINLVVPYSKKDIKEKTRELLHEIGHKYWFTYLDEEKQKLWSQFFNKEKYIITEEDMQGLAEAGVYAYQNVEKPYGSDFFRKGNLTPFLNSDKLLFVYELMLLNEVFLFSDFSFRYEDMKKAQEGDVQAIFEKLKQLFVGKPLIIGAVTNYSTTKGAFELFPEVFSFVIGGYDVPDVTRKLFKRTTGI